MGLAQAGSSVAMGMAGVVPLGLLTSLAVSRVAGLVTLGVRAGRGIPWGSAFSDIPNAARRYRRFPLLNTWSRLANSVGLQLPIVLLLALYGEAETGWYALTLRVLASPIAIVVDAASQYFEGTLAGRVRDGSGELTSLVRRFFVRMLTVGIAPAVVVMLWGPSLFAFIFGETWRGSGHYAQILVIAYLAQLAVVPISRTLTILERQGAQLVWDLCRAVGTVAIVVASAALDETLGTCLIILAAFQTLSYAAMLLMALRATRSRERDGRDPFLRGD